MSYQVGDTASLSASVDPADATTDATLTVTAPDDTTSTPAVTKGTVSDAGTVDFTASLLADQDGVYLMHWVITGTGAGVQDGVVAVEPELGTDIDGSYATIKDLVRYTRKAAPDNAAELLVQASQLVRDATMCAVYPTDNDGIPTETFVQHALRDAACAQVGFWVKLKIDPTLGMAGAAATVTQKQIGTASLAYQQDSDAAKAKALAATTLCDDALSVLARHNLLTNSVWRFG